MRNRETYFEQVPIEVAEAVLRQPAVPATRVKKERPRPARPRRPDSARLRKARQSAPRKGRL